MDNRVVVTGYGAVTPLGPNMEDTWQRLIAGSSGIDYITLFDTANFNVKIAAEAKDFKPLNYLDPNTARYSDRFSQFAAAASLQAIEKAKLTIDDTNRYDIGILIGSGIGGLGTLSHQIGILNTRGSTRVSPYLAPMMITDSASSRVSMLTGTRGPNLSLVSACSTGTDALGIAYKMIKYGDCKAVIAGGADATITPIGVASFQQAGALSKNADPQKASRPFDALRNGFVIGEGAGIVVLERLDYALSRGAPILAEIAGYGATSDAYHVTQPLSDGEAAAKAIEIALADLDRADVDYVNAHGTSTPLNDVAETRAIKKVFGAGAYKIPVSSIKSMVGHMLGAAGAVEAIVCCKVLAEGIIPPTINLEHPDPECDLDYVPHAARTGDIRLIISNSFGFGGHNSVLAMSKYSER
jgi:3-oxoacyl-[acyl-carrier-protein] synthase II